MAWEGSTRLARLPPNWPALRAARLRLDGHRCTWITDGRRCTSPATDVDHRDAMTDDHRLEALRSLCGLHHSRKSSREGNRARAIRRAALTLPPEDHPGLIPSASRRRRLGGPGG